MDVPAILIQQPSVDWKAFLSASYEVLGYSPAQNADADARRLTDVVKFLACLSAIEDERGDVLTADPHHLSHVSYTAMLAMPTHVTVEFLSRASGMAMLCGPTQRPGVDVVIVTGTLNHWRDAIVSGTGQDPGCRACYCKLHALFEAAGLGHVWADYNKQPVHAGRNPHDYILIENH